LSVSSSAFNAGLYANFDVANGRIVRQPTNGAARMMLIRINDVPWWYIEISGVATGVVAPDPQLWTVAGATSARRAVYIGPRPTRCR
jgi:hypothetical protein